MNTPIKLPLDGGINRCLAHGSRPGEWCERRYECAAHETIKHDHGKSIPTQYRKCWTDNWVGFIPLDGFPPKEDDTPAIDWDETTTHA